MLDYLKENFFVVIFIFVAIAVAYNMITLSIFGRKGFEIEKEVKNSLSIILIPVIFFCFMGFFFLNDKGV